MAVFKIVVVGSEGVGKSALCGQYVGHYFNENYDPTIEDMYTKRTEVNGDLCVLEIIDTGGSEEFSTLRKQCINNGQGLMCVFALNNEHSYSSIAREICLIRKTRNVPIVLVGNKLDAAAKSSTFDPVALSEYHQISYVKTSAKTTEGVENAFLTLVTAMQQQEITVETNERKSCCCALL